MQQAQLNESFAGSDRQYVVGQGKVNGQSLHLQFAGAEGNRAYGYSTDIVASQDVLNFFGNTANRNAVSLTGSTRPYIKLQASVDSGSNIHFQALGNGGNRKYGLSFNLSDAGLKEWLGNQLDPDTDDDDEDEGDEVATPVTIAPVTVQSASNTLDQIIALLGQLKTQL